MLGICICVDVLLMKYFSSYSPLSMDYFVCSLLYHSWPSWCGNFPSMEPSNQNVYHCSMGV